MPDGVPAPAPAPQLDAQERFTQERFKAWYAKWHAVAKYLEKDTKGSDQRWFGRVATAIAQGQPVLTA